MAQRPRKKFERTHLWAAEELVAGSGEAESAVHQEPVAEGQLFLGPYPVMKHLPTFENATFRKLCGTVKADQPPMTQKELGEYVKIRREVQRRIQQAQKIRKKKERREQVRKRRREEHERNTLRRRARGLPSRSVLCRFVGQRQDANRIWGLTGKILGFPKREKVTKQVARKTDNSCGLKSDEEEGWEDSDDDEEDDGDQDSDHSDDFDDYENAERGWDAEMEYDDASGEITEVPRKWGKWFNSVRKDEGDEELF